MKWILYIEEIEVGELCEWVKEDQKERECATEIKDCASDLYVYFGDLESDREYVRYADVADDTKCRVLSDNLRPLPDGWIPMDSLSYDSNVGLRWNNYGQE